MDAVKISSRGRPVRFALVLLGVGGMLAAFGGASSAQEPADSERLTESGFGVKTIATGLDNPRGMAVTETGVIYVVEAGQGGSRCLPGGPEGRFCYGKSGAVTKIENGRKSRVLGGLPSASGEDGGFAAGPHDVTFTGSGAGQRLFVTVGEGARRATGDGRFSRLLGIAGGNTRNVANLLRFERENNSDGAEDPFTGDPELNSNPYSTVSYANGTHIVADAGANALIKVGPDGKLSVRAVFPTRRVANPGDFGLPPGFRYQSVPDAVAAGPGGTLYVGELTGYPFLKGAARVYKVRPDSRVPRVYAEGFTNIIDIAVGRDGSVYVLELLEDGLLQAEEPGGSLAGRLVRISPTGRQAVIADGDDGLTAPAGLAIGPKGAIYISNKGVFADEGEVLRLLRR